MNIIQISDTHIQAEPGATFDGVDSARTLAAVLAHINASVPLPDLILLTGDLVHEPDAASYQRLGHLLEKASAPVYVLPGNHDNPALMPQYLDTVHHDKHIRRNGWLVLLLNSWLPNEHAGELSTQELDWLDQQLADHAGPVLVALHHPPVKIGSPWMDGMMLRNPQALFAVLDKYPQIQGVIWGHIHQVYEAQHNGMRLLGCPSTCVQFKPHSSHYAVDALGPGYRRIQLHDQHLHSEVIRVRTD